MNLSFYIAKRYIFSKKSHNAINVISMISVCGIAIATAAMVCALSVFNGFTDIAARSFSAIDPQLQIAPAKGKVFNPDDPDIQAIKKSEGIQSASGMLEENALIKFADRQVPALIKGVSPEFLDQINAGDILLDGDFKLKEGDVQYSVIGAGLAMTLGLRAGYSTPLEIYVPKRNAKVNTANPAMNFTISYAYPGGIFALNQQQYDEQTLFVSIELAREIFRYENEVSYLNLMLKDGASSDRVKKEIKAILGENYLVKDRFEQQEESFHMVSIEKWVTFLILSFILIIATFNTIGSLSMLILEKKDDINILRNMGAGKKLILRIFSFEGWLICFIGAMSGLIIGLTLCLLQQHFGLLKLGSAAGAFIIDAYPVSVQAMDVVFIFLTVLLIGFVAVLYPVDNLKKQLRK
ncbi:ABC transporter permease [Viscerimonas tarda]